MARVVMHLDMVHICRLPDTVNLPKIGAITESVGVLTYFLSVTLEVDRVNFIVSNECLEQLDVRQGESVSSQELRLRQVLVKLFHMLRVILDRDVIGFLRFSESSLVDPVVDIIVYPAIYIVHLFLKGLWCKIKFRIRGPFVELTIEHLNYLRGLVIHDRLELFVPQ